MGIEFCKVSQVHYKFQGLPAGIFLHLITLSTYLTLAKVSIRLLSSFLPQQLLSLPVLVLISIQTITLRVEQG